MSGMGDRNVDKGKKKRRYQPGAGREVSWRDADAGTLRDLICAVTGTGCAVRFGYSRDRGAYCIGVIGDGEPYTVWAGHAEELDIRIESLLQAFLAGERDNGKADNGA